MRLLLPILFLPLVACTAARRYTITPDGSLTVEHGGQLGGRSTLAYTRTPKGGVKFVEDINNEKSFSDGVIAAVSAVGLVQTGLSNRATTAADAATAQGAQKATVAGQKIAADVDMARIAADVEKHNGPILPVTPTQ